MIVGFTGVISPFWGAVLAEEMHIPYIDYWLDATDQLVPEAFLRPLARMIQRKTLSKATLVLTINNTLKSTSSSSELILQKHRFCLEG